MTTKIPEQSLRQFRLNKISEISNVLDECDKTIEDLSERLEWDKKQLLAEQNIKRAQCPFNVHHVMTKGDLDNHIQKCRMKQMGFAPCESSSKFYDSTSSVVSITTDVTSTSEGNHRDLVIPSEYHVYMHTPDERLSHYDNDIKITSSKRKAERDLESDLSESPLDSKETISGNLKSELELLAEKRDYKRRRQSYRAKNVHITKRTPIEITREIINNRMEELQNVYEETKKAPLPSKDNDEK
ncbi:Hypothetical predicted protein [Paramuricea clavata]|uniref:Uncharacterized protein n=1 Tax=Paramuricea clavata TaxID=317549 RepID=A0A7D9HD45_PARCT|nr:Hypothetical predicted protein [Paramuricea clavata]